MGKSLLKLISVVNNKYTCIIQGLKGALIRGGGNNQNEDMKRFSFL